MSGNRPFMTTAWTHLAMLNYEVDGDLLTPHVPAGMELDSFEGRTFVSMVGFRFQRTRVMGVPIPFHRNFAEINLRFYVRRRAAEGWRRGVVFLKEIVALPAVAWAAKTFYDENFSVLPLRYLVETTENNPELVRSTSYRWQLGGADQRLEVQTTGTPQPTVEGSEEQFIAEHYWGYTRRRDGSTTEFRVDHPPWRIWNVSSATFECDVEQTYGGKFAAYLNGVPSSAFLAEGSDVSVYRGRELKAECADISARARKSELVCSS